MPSEEAEPEVGEPDRRSTEDVRRDIVAESEELAGAVEDLRAGVGETASRGKPPLIAASVLGAGFVLAGGVGATVRFVARRARR